MGVIVTPDPPPADIAILWSSADLLRRCKQHARRPAVDASMTDVYWYSFLTEAQAEVYSDLFPRFPDLGYLEPRLMETDDGGLSYTFGWDQANEDMRPTGHAVLYPSLDAIPDDPLVPGEDYLMEGGRVRMLGHLAVTYTDGPYARFVLPPDQPISATYEPLLLPKPARMLLVWKALQHWAARPGSGALPIYYESQYDKLLAKILNDFATAYNQHVGTKRWFTASELSGLAGYLA